MGELFPGGPFESMLLDGQTLGGEEGAAALDAVARTRRDGLETVE